MWWDVYVCTYIDSNVCALLYTTWMCQEVAEENQKHSAAVRLQSFVSCRDLVWFGRISSTSMGAWKVDTREVRPGRSDRWVMLGKHDSPKQSTAVNGAHLIVPIFYCGITGLLNPKRVFDDGGAQMVALFVFFRNRSVLKGWSCIFYHEMRVLNERSGNDDCLWQGT